MEAGSRSLFPILGPGFSDQAKPHIFDMFYSASDPIADSRRSMGLGLALCKSINQAHGGEIAVADRSPMEPSSHFL